MFFRLYLALLCILSHVYVRLCDESDMTSSIDSSSTVNKFLYYVTSDEGISSHVRQLYHLWNGATSANRSIYVVGYHSKHYPDVPVVNLCDLFNLPSNVICIPDSNITILSTHKCIYVSTIHPPSRYGWQDLVNQTYDFSYTDVECVAGQITPSIGRFPNVTLSTTFLKSSSMFSKKYKDMFPMVKKALGVSKGDYATVHWRRGDQIHSRCGKSDLSFNCDNEKQFVEDLKGEMNKYLPKSKSKITTYIATNERDGKRLNHLIRNDYKLFYHLRKEFLKVVPPMHMTTLDVFMVELLLMCDSRYFFSWGVSAVNEFMFNHCRELSSSSKQVTVCNGTRLNESYIHTW